MPKPTTAPSMMVHLRVLRARGAGCGARRSGPAQFCDGSSVTAFRIARRRRFRATAPLPRAAISLACRVSVTGVHFFGAEHPNNGRMSLEHETIVETAIEGRSVLGMLASLPLFRDLEVPLLSGIANEIEWFSLPGGGTLFEAGDEPDALYFVINGCLGAYRRALDGHSQLIGRIMAGETVGEMALISGKVRTATLVAPRDTEIGRFSKTALERLVLSHPQGLLAIAQLPRAPLEAS